MQLTSLNTIHYVLQQNWRGEFSVLEKILVDNNFSVEVIDKNQPRNTILKIITSEKSFIFKQPKYITSGATWLINSEAKFYENFGQNLANSKFDFNYHVLVLDFLEHYNIPKLDTNENLKKAQNDLSKLLADFHNNFSISNNKVNRFIRNNSLYSSSVYSNFYNHIKKGHYRNDYLDEMVFPNLAGRDEDGRLKRAILYDFLNSNKFFDALNDFLADWYQFDKYLIHGDISLKNILKLKNKPVLIDFELISKGDNAWDVACLLESIILKVSQPNDSVAFFMDFISEYLSILKLKQDNKAFTIRVMKFWAFRRLEKLRITKNIGPEKTDKILVTIEKLFIHTERYYKHFSVNNSDAQSIFAR